MSASFDNSPLYYEKEAMKARRRLSSNLDQLAENLTAGRMLDEVLGYARGGGASFLKGLGTAASENPVPALLMSVGAAMFLTGRGRVGQAANDTHVGNGRSRGSSMAGAADKNGVGTIHKVASGASHRVADAGAAISGAAGDARDAVASAAAGTGEYLREGAEAVGGLAHAVTETLHDAAGAIGHRASDAASAVKDAADAAVDRAEHFGEDAAQLAEDFGATIRRYAKEQPLMVAAAGLAIGAAVAAILPRTTFEDSLMGETSDAVKEGATDVASDAYDRAKEAAGHIAEEVSDAARESGVGLDTIKDAVRTTADKVSTIADAGMHAVTEEVAETAQEGSTRATRPSKGV